MIYFLFVVSLAVFISVMVWMRWRDSKYLQKKTLEAIRPQLRQEIEEEKAEFVRRQKAFDRSMLKVEQKRKHRLS